MPKIIHLSTALVGVPSQNPLTKSINVQLISSVHGVDDEGQVWEYNSVAKEWTQVPMNFVIPVKAEEVIDTTPFHVLDGGKKLDG